MQRCVYLGFFDRPVSGNDNTPAEHLSKFGGKPVWIDGVVPRNYPFFCGKCKCQLYFFCQVSTPVPNTRRCLYVFGCKNAKCCEASLGWMILRATVREDVPLNKGERTNLETQVEKPASDEHARGRKVSSKHYGDEGSEEFLPPAFIGIEQEPDEFSYRDAMTIRAEELELDYRKSLVCTWILESGEFSGFSLPAEKKMVPLILRTTKILDTLAALARILYAFRQGLFCSEQYEGSADKAFRRFQKRLLRSPQQAIRYCFEGAPLLLGDVGQCSPQRCPHCGSERVFEMQLMPNAAHELQRRCRVKDRRGVALHWTTVVAFTCKKDCVPPDTYTSEQVFVQESL